MTGKATGGHSVRVLAMVICTLLAAGCGGKEAQGEDQKKAKGRRGPGVRVVTVEEIQTRDLLRTGNYRGELRAEKVVEVAPDVQGRIKKLHVDMGSTVEKGDLLVELDPLEMSQLVREGKAGVEKAQASIEQARVSLEKAQKDMERKKPLAAKGLITDAEMTDLETAVKSAESALAVAQAQKTQSGAALKNLLINKKNLKVRAPFDGVVARRYLNEGAMASPSTPVFQLHAGGKLYMRIAVPEKDVALVLPDMTGQLELDALPGRTLVFTVALVSPVIEQVTRTCTVDLLVNVPDSESHLFKPGMTGEATLVLDEVKDALAVPRDAIVEREGQNLIFVVQDGKAAQREIELMGDYGDWVLTEGVEAGVKVVVKGNVDLEDGVDVAIASLE